MLQTCSPATDTAAATSITGQLASGPAAATAASCAGTSWGEAVAAVEAGHPLGLSSSAGAGPTPAPARQAPCCRPTTGACFCCCDPSGTGSCCCCCCWGTRTFRTPLTFKLAVLTEVGGPGASPAPAPLPAVAAQMQPRPHPFPRAAAAPGPPCLQAGPTGLAAAVAEIQNQVRIQTREAVCEIRIQIRIHPLSYCRVCLTKEPATQARPRPGEAAAVASHLAGRPLSRVHCYCQPQPQQGPLLRPATASTKHGKSPC